MSDDGVLRLRFEHETVEEFGRPIRYSRVVGDGEAVVLGPWMRSEAAAVDALARAHPAVAREAILRVIRSSG